MGNSSPRTLIGRANLWTVAGFLACLFLLASSAVAAENVASKVELKRSLPNIIWVMGEDMSTEISCYGHPGVRTPNFDQLAQDGIRFTNAFCTAASCTPSRNAMMTGVYQTRTDTQDQRRRGIKLPAPIKPITKLLQENGYYTALGCGFSSKTDLNFETPNLFDGDDWRHRKPNQPFFAQITLYDSHRLKDNWKQVSENQAKPVDRDAVQLPPYFPDHPSVREDWARYLESIQTIDGKFGQLIKRLDAEGIADNTVIIFIGDNGRCHLRGKCWLYDAGLKVPFLLKVPTAIAGRLKNAASGSTNDDLVSTIDISATVLQLAGVELPEYLDGQSLVGEQYEPREAIFGARDLIDEVMDRIRCVRTQKYKYIRNYNPENGYRECLYVQRNRPMLSVIRELDREGRLSPAQQLILKTVKPSEELYDVAADPHEVNNLAADLKYAKQLKSLRSQLDRWLESTGDTGLKQMREFEASDQASLQKRFVDIDSYLEPIKSQLQIRWPKNRTVRVVAHGHSVPTGYFRSGKVETFKAYPHLLHRKISEAYPNAVVNMIPTGIGGESAKEGAKRFADDVLALKPDVITIDYGLNDRRNGLKETREAWSSMIEMAKENDIKVILLTPTGDLNANIQDASDKLSRQATQIRELAAEHQVGIVDSYRLFREYEQRNGGYEDLMSQGNHPNFRGHQLVAEGLAKWFLPVRELK
jgi:arylsulfatase A-like enzyme/lysophospholipase L1-like esterase